MGAFALVRLKHGGSDYLLDFDTGKVRLASRSEYIRFPGGLWYLRLTSEMVLAAASPPEDSKTAKAFALRQVGLCAAFPKENLAGLQR